MTNIDHMIEAGEARLQEIDEQVAQARNVIAQLTNEAHQLVGRINTLKEVKQLGLDVFHNPDTSEGDTAKAPESIPIPVEETEEKQA